MEADSTDGQMEAMAPNYFNRAPKTGVSRLVSQLIERKALGMGLLFVAWSRWTADGLVAEGIDRSMIRIIPPGVDLDAWPARPVAAAMAERPLRLLFVGGDFRRKGGDLLAGAVERLAGEVEAKLVTRDDVGALPPGVTVLRAGPNSPELRDAHEWSDIFVMPTRADCFGIATIEAMAAGRPVIVGDVGGARDIVEDGRTGWLVQPELDHLVTALRHALANRDQLAPMGQRAREVAEARFSAATNARRVADTVLEAFSLGGRG
jgi:glycosyltransferase involved in cell wall biosynthesis